MSVHKAVKLGYALDKAIEARGAANHSLGEKHAYGMGFMDGYYGYEMNRDCDPFRSYLNAYSAGYWDGQHAAYDD